MLCSPAAPIVLELPVTATAERTLKGLLNSEACRMIYGSTSAFAAVRWLESELQLPTQFGRPAEVDSIT